MNKIKYVQNSKSIVMYDEGGQQRYYSNTNNGTYEATIQFYNKHGNGRFSVASKKYPYEFYRFIWDKILNLPHWRTAGSPHWYECVDFLNIENKEQIERAWLMYRLERNDD